MLLLKPEVVLAVVIAPVTLTKACCGWVGRTLCGKKLIGHWCVQRMRTMFGSAVRLEQRSAKVVVQLARQESKQMTKLGRKMSTRLKRRPSYRFSKHTSEEAGILAVSSHVAFDRASAALVVQRLWRHRNPRVLAAHHNITVLKRQLLSFVSTAKHLRREDFLLVSGLQVQTVL